MHYHYKEDEIMKAKRFLKTAIACIMACLCCAGFLACDQGPAENEQLKEYKQTLSRVLDEFYAQPSGELWEDYDVKFYDYFYGQLRESITLSMEKAESYDELYRAVDIPLDMVRESLFYSSGGRDLTFSVSDSKNAVSMYKIDTGDGEIIFGNYSPASPLGYVAYPLQAEGVVPADVTVKIYFGDGIEFSGGEASPIVIKGEENGGEAMHFGKSYKLLTHYENHLGGSYPSCDSDKSYDLTYVFERNGFAIGYCTLDITQRVENNKESIGLNGKNHVKGVLYPDYNRRKVTAEKALEYAEAARQGANGEKNDGIDYIPVNVASGIGTAHKIAPSDSAMIEHFEIVQENKSGSRVFALTGADSAELVTDGAFVSGGGMTQSLTVRTGDKVVYKNLSGKTEFIEIIFKKGDRAVGFSVLAIEPGDASAPLTKNSFAAENLGTYMIYTPENEKVIGWYPEFKKQFIASMPKCLIAEYKTGQKNG